uniref:Uncharacterized protein n=1 Tax=Candidatus Kentrum sp. LPFa TaxID=2126335 RepID=A0A450WAH2_9GAMM|nr:MAG: hypothetical protein BECKLPF1236A_GA0070988_100993 [Candidatus Kentron sp. LPFa]VFK30319.1 MAG: hypothetical protein BECKLPF1236C_GA0070990_101083 [Candidatus Kentron sp. LPFa]
MNWPFWISFIALLVAMAAFIHQRSARRKENEEHEKTKNELEDIKALAEEQKNKYYSKGIYADFTLKAFEKTVTMIAQQAKKDFRLACATPLLGAMREEGARPYDYHHHDGKEHWPAEFCDPFITALKENKRELDIRIIRLENTRLKEILPLLKNNHMSATEHLDSIKVFLERATKENNGREPATAFSMNIPIYMALRDVDSEDANRDKEEAPLGCVAFMSSDVLFHGLYKGKSPEEIAGKVITIQFWETKIRDFFVDAFDHLYIGATHTRAKGFWEILVKDVWHGLYDVALTAPKVYDVYFSGECPSFDTNFLPKADQHWCNFYPDKDLLQIRAPLSGGAYEILKGQCGENEEAKTRVAEAQEFCRELHDAWKSSRWDKRNWHDASIVISRNRRDEHDNNFLDPMHGRM